MSVTAAGSNDPATEPFFKTTEAGAGPTSGSITHMDDYPSYEIADGLFFRPVFAENMSLNFVTFPPDSGFPVHDHPEEQVSIVREGHMEISIAGVPAMVRPGDVIIFPPNIPHAGRTFDEACRLIDVFSPSRTGMKEVIASADPVRSADVDRWWAPDETGTVEPS